MGRFPRKESQDCGLVPCPEKKITSYKCVSQVVIYAQNGLEMFPEFVR